MFAIYRIRFGSVGLENVCITSKYTMSKPTNAIITQGHNLSTENTGGGKRTKKWCTETNERHSLRPQPNPRKFRNKMARGTISAVFSSFFLCWVGLGLRVRWFQIMFICFPTEQNLLNLEHHHYERRRVFLVYTAPRNKGPFRDG